MAKRVMEVMNSRVSFLVLCLCVMAIWLMCCCLRVPTGDTNEEVHQTFVSLTHSPLGNLNDIFRHVILKQILVIDGWGTSCEIALGWMSLNLTDDKSTLVQVMAWCRQATCHYLSQCWPRSLLPCGVTRRQWVNEMLINFQIYLK